ncbi:hypothetical protein A3C67_00505 [Candidatus Nomurabacteria bacterium RIFCSPHIGHO2_02_FULL_42_19]|uniref:Uncharacterized protein n=1 Tax=Candidatus Nomurabacteria bacterium RIFCSPHIGHO2_02_FULL_42_19 TaxID=1801756 RepID=A0A1F6W2L6_9BACT|nr:MAG: hypothetical protein A3C67_00505 [Candidatus Nomurabacteria bacterium RIFCSPHIGHO2_02_FULL_42_19]
MQKKENNSGFIALMSAIIISVVLLLLATNLSLIGFYGRFNILDSELKERSSTLAEACADTAILKLANNPGYNPANEPVNVGGDTCIIQSVTGGDTIHLRADYKNYITNLKIAINPSDLSVVSWEEIPTYP